MAEVIASVVSFILVFIVIGAIKAARRKKQAMRRQQVMETWENRGE